MNEKKNANGGTGTKKAANDPFANIGELPDMGGIASFSEIISKAIAGQSELFAESRQQEQEMLDAGTEAYSKAYANRYELLISALLDEEAAKTDYWEETMAQIGEIENVTIMAQNALMGLSQAFVDMAATGELSVKQLTMATLDSVRQIIMAKLGEAIAAMIAGEAPKGVLGLITAGIGITGIMALFNSIPKFESGGIVGGSSYTGDTVSARVNSGEMILNKIQQGELFAMANGMGGRNQVEVVGYISGDVIRLANKRSTYISERRG